MPRYQVPIWNNAHDYNSKGICEVASEANSVWFLDNKRKRSRVRQAVRDRIQLEESLRFGLE